MGIDLNTNLYRHKLLSSNNNVNGKKCTMCHKNTELIRLPEEFQVYSRKKNFESFFCGNCVQIVNFVRSKQ